MLQHQLLRGMSNFSLKVLEEAIENVHVVFLPQLPDPFDIAVREMSYQKHLPTDEKKNNQQIISLV